MVVDDAALAEDVAGTLSSLGYRVLDVVATGREAIRAARGEEPDLVLVNLPLSGGLDGVAAVREIRDEREVPVVFLSARADDATLREVSGELPCGFVVEPFDARGLRAEIEIALARFRTERRLRERERWFERVVVHSRAHVALLDREGTVQYESPAGERVLGRPAEDRVGRSALDAVHPDDRDAVREVLARCARSPGREAEVVVRVEHADGGWRSMEVVGRSFEGPHGDLWSAASARDVSRLRDVAARLREREAHLRCLFEGNVAGAFRATAAGEILAANRSLARMSGHSSPRVLEGTSLTTWAAAAAEWEELIDRLRERGTLRNVQLQLEARDGAPVRVTANLLLHRGDDGDVVVGTAVDPTRWRPLDSGLRSWPFEDFPPGRASRGLVEHAAERTLALAARRRGHAAILFVEVGEVEGARGAPPQRVEDAALARIARRLERDGRASDLFWQTGDHEFAAVLPEVDGPAAAVSAGRRLAGVLARPLEVEGRTVSARVRIGVAVFPEHGDGVRQLLSAARGAVSDAKDASEDPVSLFDPGSDAVGATPVRPDRRVREALDGDQFVLHYQPVVRAGDGTVDGAEAFARWIHPERGLLAAADFVSTAERQGWASELDRRVVERLLADVDVWRPDARPGWVSVNLGPTTLRDPEFRRWLGRTLHGQWPDGLRLVFDVSERTAVHNPDILGSLLSDLAGLPVSVALDDFGSGSGPGSVSFLNRAPVQILKLRPGPTAAGGRAVNERLTRALIELGHAAGVEVTVKDVELEAQYESALHAGPDFVQGYFTGPPVPPEQFDEGTGRNAE